jgi:membrane protein implicated in regulation of membrane protease activity
VTRIGRRLLLAAILTLACTCLVFGLAILTTGLLGHLPAEFSSWLLAFVAVSGLAASRAVPGPRRPARPGSRAPRTAFHPGPAAAAALRRPEDAAGLTITAA